MPASDREQDCTDKQQGREPAKIAHGIRADEYKTHESAYGRDVTDRERLDNIFDHEPRVGHTSVMTDEMQRIIDGYTEHDGADADGDNGDFAPDKVHQSESKQPAEGDGSEDQPDFQPVAKSKDQEREHDYYGEEA